ncbi:MAG: DUF1926 domain-containing protein [Spirochaetaceae bacterium]|nr:DUF1926 domain-containing protein [Spirochaetaceae bacterium]
MGKIHICFDVSVHLSVEQSLEEIEKQYYQFYKKLAAFLYKHPQFSLSLYFPGILLEWLEKKHPELITILSDLINKKQIEILGGGYYEPIFPLILPFDRVGQIEYLTTALRKAFGKRIKGIKVPHSIFNTSLIQNFTNCGIDYVLLQSNILKTYAEDKDSFFPILLEETGKTILGIPSRQEEKPMITTTPESFLKKMQEIAHKTTENGIFSCSFSPKEFSELLTANWFEKFYELVKDSDYVSFSTIALYLKNHQNIQQGFLVSDCPQELAQWALSPYQKSKLKDAVNFKTFLHTYPEISSIYARMNITQNFIQLGKGDKARKKAAQEELWQAQNSFAFFYNGTDSVGKKTIREAAYKHLLLSEKLIKDIGTITEFCVSSDMNFDGYKEYLFASEFYNTLVTSKQGCIAEFDVLHNFKNYSDTSKRNDFLDKLTDNYEKKIFVDHLVENELFDKFIHNQNSILPTFANKVYKEVAFDRKRREIQLYCQSFFGVLQQEVAIKKNYTFTQNGILVRYILCNKSPFPIKGKFVIESNFCFSDCNQDNLKIEVIADDTRELPCPNQLYIRQDVVSHLQLTDSNSKVTFNIEPNEQGGVFIQPLYINRLIAGVSEKQFQASTTCFYWDVEIAPGLELEKNLFLTVNTPVKKLKQKK